MKNFLLISILFTGLCGGVPGLCQYSNVEFVENKGQWDDKVKFKGLINNGAFFLEEKGFTVLKSDDDDVLKVSEAFHGHYTNKSPDHTQQRTSDKPADETLTVKSHAYKVRFVNASTPVIVGDKPLNTFNNYFIGNDPAKWAADCKIFQAVTYQNLYPGVDVRYYTNGGKMKYDIIVKEGADLTSIAMKYDGVNKLSVQNEELVISTSVGDMKELAPYAYQVINGVKKEVVCRFKVSGKLVQFSVQNYQKNAPLIIDPFLVFSTFTGSTADNWGYTATYGSDGSFYAGGIVFGQGFPVSPGAFQTNYQGGVSESNLSGYDIGIMKFNPTGSNRIYATYIGGSGNEQPHSLIVDAQGNLVIAGRTNSPNYPTTAATFGAGGDYDIVITKLNAAGNGLIGSRKIGGSGRDGVNIRPKYEAPQGAETIRRNYGDDSRSEVILDGAGNILVASNTQSGNFPVTASAFQSSFSPVANNRQDGVVIKTSADVSTVLFSSYLGGGGDDAAFVLAIHPQSGNIYIGGNTTSGDLPGNTLGSIYPTFQNGVTDGFVTIINPSGSAILKTTYIGTPGNDMLYGIQFDKFGYPYIMGTTSSNNWPISNAAYSVPGGKQFIAKLQPDLSAYVYSTVFGTSIASSSPNISPIAFLVDRCENVYVSGWGGEINSSAGTYPNSGTTALPVTPDAYQNRTDGSDFYFFVMERNATRQLYGTYFGQNSTNGGGEHVDGGTSRFDRNGIIYQAMCANCGRSATFPTTPGVWASTNGSPSCNLAAVKMSFDLAGISTSIRASINGVARDTSGCVPLKVDFSDTVAEGKSYIWNFGDGSPNENTTSANNSHTYNNIGSYRVMLVSIDSTSCNIADTAYTTIIVRNDIANLDFSYAKQGTCASTTYQFNNTSNAPAGKPFTNQSFRWNFGDGTPVLTAGLGFVSHTFPGVGSYRVTLTLVDTNYCNAPDSLPKTVRIAQNVAAAFKTPSSGCAPYTAVFINESKGGIDFLWNFGDGTTSTAETPVHDYATPGTYTITLIVTDTSTCNKTDTATFTITVSGKPTAAFYYTPNPPQENLDVEFFNTSIGATRYIWHFGDGDTLATTSTLSVKHAYNETRLFNPCLVAINAAGCPDTVCQPLQAKVIPLLDVPSAFTPNGDGVNDRVFVRGFGIAKMTWRIYNRWGTMVFQTVDRHTGWDGRYNGELQPKEVYHYVLNVEFSDGAKHQKKGDITLL